MTATAAHVQRHGLPVRMVIATMFARSGYLRRALEAWGEADPPSERERQVLRLAGEGLGAADIAVRLGLSHGIVCNCLS